MANYPDDDSHQSVGARLHGYNPIRSQWEPVTINSEGQVPVEITATVNVKDILSTVTHAVATASAGLALEITAISNQKIVKVVPLASTPTVYWGPTSAVSANTHEGFDSTKPVNVTTNSSIWITVSAGSITVAVYRGA